MSIIASSHVGYLLTLPSRSGIEFDRNHTTRLFGAQANLTAGPIRLNRNAKVRLWALTRALSKGPRNWTTAGVDLITCKPFLQRRLDHTLQGNALMVEWTEGKVIHIPDVLADPDFTRKEGQRLGGFRTVLGVPMLREGVAAGLLALTRSAVRPFNDDQIALVENFAAQAAIAIENARLLNELRQRTTDLTERTADL